MGKKKCELCHRVARMFCESDQARLCYDCDVKVHGANFLVAKHTRCLLCSACQSPTPWKSSGLRLCPTVSICDSCFARKKNSGAGSNYRNLQENLSQEINSNGDRSREDDGAISYDDDEEDEESDEEEEEEEEEDEEEEEEEEAENQVVPWDAAAVMSSSSSVSSGEEGFSGDGGLLAKRTRRDSDLNSSDEESNDSRPLKRLTRDETSPRSTASMKSTLKIKRREKIKRL